MHFYHFITNLNYHPSGPKGLNQIESTEVNVLRNISTYMTQGYDKL